MLIKLACSAGARTKEHVKRYGGKRQEGVEDAVRD